MRKILLVLSTFAVLTFSLTQPALAEWKANTIINRTTDDIYVIYSTWRSASDVFPTGYRTRGYYRIAPGEQHSFDAWSDNDIYFRIEQSGEGLKPQSSTPTFAFWIHQREGFAVVSQQLHASVTRGQLTYSSPGRDALLQVDGFMKYSNGSTLTVTSGWVSLGGWKATKITNRTTKNIYVIYSTWWDATNASPAGYQTRGYYRIDPGEQRSFYGRSRSIYFRISQSGEALKPQSSTPTFALWVHPSKAFRVVSQQLDASVPRGQLTYSNLDRDTLSQEEGFMKYSNGSTLTVTSGWVSAEEEPSGTRESLWRQSERCTGC